ncbi:DUF1413 domain-containing protein [Staphylococcus caeli]|uniref:IraB protein n=1 Tax=Staphylococcus caeli TaxID=2201815 RepID=A0A1D4HFJ8_9STAP|nr:DUF1413 domain-containing protein [Staphylococcus caeli]SCS35938.1 IraB protein [Staphylococcus caeli]SCS53872.1 IraB protein [Staphylococcus caeli]
MNFDVRLETLRQSIDKTSFEFHFEALFDKEEWIQLPIAERKRLENEFRKYVAQHSHLRIPYASEDHIRMRMYNSLYAYNEIKHNFKAYV